MVVSLIRPVDTWLKDRKQDQIDWVYWTLFGIDLANTVLVLVGSYVVSHMLVTSLNFFKKQQKNEAKSNATLLNI